MTLLAALALLFGAGAVPPEPTPGPAPTAVSPAPTSIEMIDLRMVRMKISAGDLYSAESILEYHRAQKGEDAEYVLALAWLARGAVVLGDTKAAARYAKAARQIALARLGTPPVYDGNSEALYALGSSIEVEAQLLAAAGKKAEAVRLLEDESRALEKAPYNIRARLWKRRNQIELVGEKAPDFRAEDHVGGEFQGLASLSGKPVVLFLWWESCGDCRMEAPALKKTIERFTPRGVAFVAPTRYYGDDHSAEKAKIEKAWTEVYQLPGSVSAPISDQAMLRYGVSATPTFVFIDRQGVVRAYFPFRMSEERLDEQIESLLR